MKKVQIIIRIFVGFVPLLVGGIIGYNSYRILFIPSDYTLETNSILSTQAIEQINNFIEQNIDFKNSLSLKKIASSLKEEFACIKRVAIRQLPTKKLHIQLSTYKPLFRLNNDCILLKSGIIEPLHSFNPQSIDKLQCITVHNSAINKHQLSSPCYTCLTNCSPSVFESFDFTWNNETELILHDKKQRRFSILGDINTLTDQQKLKLYTTLQHQIMNRNDYALNKGKKWIADFRFDNQIIIFSRGGRGYGYKASS